MVSEAMKSHVTMSPARPWCCSRPSKGSLWEESPNLGNIRMGYYRLVGVRFSAGWEVKTRRAERLSVTSGWGGN